MELMMNLGWAGSMLLIEVLLRMKVPVCSLHMR